MIWGSFHKCSINYARARERISDLGFGALCDVSLYPLACSKLHPWLGILVELRVAAT